MSKSKETFEKRQREKNKLQKRMDKMEKKALRKSHAHDGNNFEEMIAYVDENGNLTSERPVFAVSKNN